MTEETPSPCFQAILDRVGDEKLPACSVGVGDRGAIFFFLSKFTNQWTGHVHQANRQPVRVTRREGEETDTFVSGIKGRMDIFAPGIPEPLFQLLFSPSLASLALLFHEEQLHLGVGQELVLEKVNFSRLSSVRRTITQLNKEDVDYEPDHPYRALVRWIVSANHYDKVLEDVPGMLPESILEPLYHRQRYDKIHKNFKDALKSLPGKVNVYTTTKQSSRLQHYEGKFNLFGLTWVLPWAVEVLLLEFVKCAMTDATFNIMRPYVCEILHVVIANESIPIAACVFPSETIFSYKRLYEDVIRVIEKAGEEKKLLLGLPLVSDQHPSLEALVNHFELDWKHCHRHLLENAGANSVTGEWMRRMLQCCSLVVATDLVARIDKEIPLIMQDATGEYLQSEKGQLLQNMIADVKQPEFRKVSLARWARWKRLGCPTTSNAQESIHAKLNHELGLVRTFFDRLTTLKNHMFRRFNDRNTKLRRRRRSVNRYLKLMDPKPGPFVPPSEEPDKSWWEFYRALHSQDRAGEEWMPRAWKFPKINYTAAPAPPARPKDHFPPPHPENELSDEPAEEQPLPAHWTRGSTVAPEAPPPRPPPAGNLDKRDHELLLPKKYRGQGHGDSTAEKFRENPHFTAIAWNLIHAVRRIAFNERSWGDVALKAAIGVVFRAGSAFYPGKDGKVTLEHEVQWRRDVFDQYHISEKARQSVRRPPARAPPGLRAVLLAGPPPGLPAALMLARPLGPPGAAMPGWPPAPPAAMMPARPLGPPGPAMPGWPPAPAAGVAPKQSSTRHFDFEGPHDQSARRGSGRP
jgi:hypothetical protein